MPMDLPGRHEATRHIAQFFAYDHLPGDLRGIGRAFHQAAEDLIKITPDCRDLTVGLDKLLDAKDFFIDSASSWPRRKNR